MPLCTALLRTLIPLCGLGLMAGAALAQAPIRIGEINSYKAQPAFLEPYRKGMELAVDEVNAAGGIAGRSRDPLGRQPRHERAGARTGCAAG